MLQEIIDAFTKLTEDPNHRYKEFGNWVRKKSRLYLVTPNIFSQIDDSLPKKLIIFTPRLFWFYRGKIATRMASSKPLVIIFNHENGKIILYK